MKIEFIGKKNKEHKGHFSLYTPLSHMGKWRYGSFHVNFDIGCGEKLQVPAASLTRESRW